MEEVNFHVDEVKTLTIKKYILQARKILNVDMNGNYTMTVICAYAIPALQYTFSIMKWTQGELHKLDIKMQKMITMKGIHQSKGNVHHIYLHRSKGGRGLTGLEDTHD
eukprot:397777-Ditylum_brightwellii.AAC.1